MQKTMDQQEQILSHDSDELIEWCDKIARKIREQELGMYELYSDVNGVLLMKKRKEILNQIIEQDVKPYMEKHKHMKKKLKTNI